MYNIYHIYDIIYDICDTYIVSYIAEVLGFSVLFKRDGKNEKKILYYSSVLGLLQFPSSCYSNDPEMLNPVLLMLPVLQTSCRLNYLQTALSPNPVTGRGNTIQSIARPQGYTGQVGSQNEKQLV